MRAIKKMTIGGETKKLPASLARKLTVQGTYDPEVAFVRAERQSEQAAADLRDLIQQVYGVQAEQVKAQIRAKLDARGILEDNTLAGIKAETDFYNDVAEQIRTGVFQIKTSEWKTLDIDGLE